MSKKKNTLSPKVTPKNPNIGKKEQQGFNRAMELPNKPVTRPKPKTSDSGKKKSE